MSELLKEIKKKDGKLEKTAVTFKSLLIATVHLHKTWMLRFHNFSAEISKIVAMCMHIYRVNPAKPSKQVFYMHYFTTNTALPFP